MAERGIFNKINETLDELIAGQRYTVNTVDKIQKEVPKVLPLLGEINDRIMGILDFADTARDIGEKFARVGQSFAAISQIATSTEEIQQTVGELNDTVLNVRPVIDSLKDQQYSIQDSTDQFLAWFTPAIEGLNQSIQQLSDLMSNILGKLEG
jgi:methyl-accepting chemotaxis protein